MISHLVVQSAHAKLKLWNSQTQASDVNRCRCKERVWVPLSLPRGRVRDRPRSQCSRGRGLGFQGIKFAEDPLLVCSVPTSPAAMLTRHVEPRHPTPPTSATARSSRPESLAPPAEAATGHARMPYS